MDQVRKRLWTPEGIVGLQKDIIPINQLEIVTLARLHEFAQKYGLSLVCRRCDTAVTGRNADGDEKAAVSCQCREFLYTR